jgi:hypothetical protein
MVSYMVLDKLRENFGHEPDSDQTAS